jgi:hypothetical protein
VVSDEFGMDWKEVFVSQLEFSLEEMSKSTNYVEMVNDLAKI